MPTEPNGEFSLKEVLGLLAHSPEMSANPGRSLETIEDLKEQTSPLE